MRELKAGITTLIVDDEPAARNRVRSLLESDPEIEVVGECRDGASSIKAIRRLRPALVFLDIEMPGADGFGVLQVLDELPAIVFVTAHQSYAIRAFEACALDYLLKPFKRDRFFDVLARAKTHIQRNSEHKNYQELIRQILGSKKLSQLFVVKSAGRMIFIRLSDLKWIEAQKDYIRLHLPKENYFVRETMNNIQNRLDPTKFIRIHRSAIVNIDEIYEINPLLGGDYNVTLRDQTKLTLSRRYRSALGHFLGQQNINLPKSS
jgi:two-component system LytT family response regulator